MINSDISANNNDNDGVVTAEEKPDYSSPNDLETEMTEAEEQAFVNETLGIDTPPSEDKPVVEPVVDPVVEPATEVKPDTVPEVKPETVPEVKPEDKPAELEAVQTDDLWVEAEKSVEDAEGNVTYEKIKLVYDPEDPSTFIPEDFKFKSDKQLADILEAKAEMASLYKERTSEYDQAKETQETSKSEEKQQTEQIAAWDADIENLIESGLLDQPKTKPGEENWKEDPSVKKIDAVFKFMVAENDKRKEAGKEPNRNFVLAFNQYNKSEADSEAVEAEKQKTADTKRKGALIGGGSASSGGGEKPYVPGSYGSIHEVPVG